MTYTDTHRQNPDVKCLHLPGIEMGLYLFEPYKIRSSKLGTWSVKPGKTLICEQGGLEIIGGSGVGGYRVWCIFRIEEHRPVNGALSGMFKGQSSELKRGFGV